MNRQILTCVFLAFASAALAAQQPAQSDPYQGQSHPPTDDVITASEPEQPIAKPPAGKPLVAPTPAPSAIQPVAPPIENRQVAPATNYAPRANDADADLTDGTDDGIVRVAPDGPETDGSSPRLSSRGYNDPDGDVVHARPLGPGEVAEGTMIRVRLLTGLSTAYSEPGEVFRSRVASDVLQDGKVLIPTGAEIEGRVVEVSEGHAGGHGSIRLRPETVILTDGQHYRMDAQVTGVPGTNTKVNGEGTINAGPRWKKDGYEYGGGVGVGVVTGAVLGGPVGALAGGLVGAGAVTVHLLSDHPQARLEPGTVLLMTLNSRLNLVASTTASN